MAQVWFGDQGEQAVRDEQMKAIESLIPGTLFYYHLYFLHLAKQKDFDKLSKNEASLYDKFKQHYERSMEFLEVETAFHVLRKMEKLPKTIDEKTSSKNIDSYLDLVEYIDKQINNHVYEHQPARPAFMSTQAQ